jgi:hypothetical protein
MPAENITLTAQWTANIDWNLDIEISFRNTYTQQVTIVRTPEYDFGTDLTGTDADTYIGQTMTSITNSYFGVNHNKNLTYFMFFYDTKVIPTNFYEATSNMADTVYDKIIWLNVMMNWDINLVRITIYYYEPI